MCSAKMKLATLLFIILINRSYQQENLVDLSTREFVEYFGYPFESYEISTDDGYIIEFYRIPHGKNSNSNSRKINNNKKIVFMMHGLYGQAENYVVNAINNGSLAFFMADNGYDVWLGNSRGTQHGRNHKTLSPSDKEFWDFSWHEIALHDLPPQIDFALNKTKNEKLHYIGHSQGGTTFYVLASMKPEYQKKISLASLLGPAGYMKSFDFPLVSSMPQHHRNLVTFMETTGMYELPPAPIQMGKAMEKGCVGMFNLRKMCEIYLNLVLGGGSGELNPEIIPLIGKYFPSAASKQAINYAQNIDSGRFRPWDYGEDKNLEVYGKIEPDDYPIGGIKTPVALYYSLGDNVVIYKDVEDICNDLGNCVKKFVMQNEKFSHLDFYLAKNARKALNEPILNLAKKYD